MKRMGSPWAALAEAEGIQPLEGNAWLEHFHPAPALMKRMGSLWAALAEAEGIQPLEGRAWLAHLPLAPAFLKRRINH